MFASFWIMICSIETKGAVRVSELEELCFSVSHCASIKVGLVVALATARGGTRKDAIGLVQVDAMLSFGDAFGELQRPKDTIKERKKGRKSGRSKGATKKDQKTEA